MPAFDAAPSTMARHTWNKQIAYTAAEGDMGLALELLQRLVAGLPDDLTALRMLLATNQLSAIETLAAEMADRAAFCGADALAAALADLRAAARPGEERAAAVALLRVEEQMQQLQALIDAG